MIPDLAVMIAVYAGIRLLALASVQQNGQLPDVMKVITVGGFLVIAYFGYDVVQLGTSVTGTLQALQGVH